VEEDMPCCIDLDPATENSSFISSFDPNELTWNIDRLDERQLPLDGQFCPAAKGDICITVYIDVSQFLAM